MYKILYSNAEQLPYEFNPSIFTVERLYLETGDYTLSGNETKICIERKSLDDYVKSISHDKERFFKEIERMKKYPIRYIIVEGNISQILDRKYSTNLPSEEVMNQTLTIMVDYGVMVMFFENRQKAVYFLEKLFLHILKNAKIKKVGKPRSPRGKNTKDIL